MAPYSEKNNDIRLCATPSTSDDFPSRLSYSSLATVTLIFSLTREGLGFETPRAAEKKEYEIFGDQVSAMGPGRHAILQDVALIVVGLEGDFSLRQHSYMSSGRPEV